MEPSLVATNHPAQPDPIKAFFDADRWRVRILFLGAFWWVPFLIYCVSIHTYYGFETPPAYWNLYICDMVQWIVSTLTIPLAVVALIIGVGFSRWLSHFPQYPRADGQRRMLSTGGILLIAVCFLAYWGVIALLVYEGIKKFVRWART